MALVTESKKTENKVLAGERDFSTLMMDIPGVLCKHGCSYMACRGLVLSPIKGMLVITHGPVGCAYYSWGGNRPRHYEENDSDDYFSYSLSTGMEEHDIIFGGENKLKQAIEEAVEIFQPAAIAICSTCPIGLIGDDIQSIAEAAEKEYGIKVMSFACEGFRSVPGYRLANTEIIENVIGTGQKQVGKYPVNIIGELCNGQRADEIFKILRRIGYDIVSVLMGDGNYNDLKGAHLAKLNLFSSDKVVADLMDVFQEKHGVEWLRFNFIGLDNIISSLKNIASFFGDPELIRNTENLVAEELARIKEDMDKYKAKFKHKVAVIYEDEFVTRHYGALFADLEIDLVIVGNDLICHEGQNEMSFLSALESSEDKVAQNAMQYTTDLEKYHLNLPASLYKKVEKVIITPTDEVPTNPAAYSNILISLLSQQEVEQLLNVIEPDIYFPEIVDNFPGIKTDYLTCFFNGDQYFFAYGGFNGALDFAQDLLMAMNMSGWQNNIAPWK